MRVMRHAGYAALRAIGTPWRMASGGGLRILAYHDVPDLETFRSHVAHLVSHYTPVNRVEDAGSAEMPVWITFDDGDPTIVEVGLPVLREFGVKATAFVCPGVIDTDEPFWWHVIERAAANEVEVKGSRITQGEVARLKRLPDAERRQRIHEIRGSLERWMGHALRVRQLSTDALRKWMDEGHIIGSHTWDHPVLPNCSPDEQARQIVDAHQWLEKIGASTDVFAYPNGDWSPRSEQVLAGLAYTVGVLFDHAIAEPSANLTMSRIRVNGTDSMNEFIAKVSGIHPALQRRRRR